jgi:hypothetical protein
VHENTSNEFVAGRVLKSGTQRLSPVIGAECEWPRKDNERGRGSS